MASQASLSRATPSLSPRAVPTLLTSMSTPPSAVSRVADDFLAGPSLGDVCGERLAPAALLHDVVDGRGCRARSRSTTRTSAPWRAKSTAMARPLPMVTPSCSALLRPPRRLLSALSMAKSLAPRYGAQSAPEFDVANQSGESYGVISSMRSSTSRISSNSHIGTLWLERSRISPMWAAMLSARIEASSGAIQPSATPTKTLA